MSKLIKKSIYCSHYKDKERIINKKNISLSENNLKRTIYERD